MIPQSEIVTVFYEGESTDFCRLNKNLVRQAGHVEQDILRVQLILNEKRHTQAFVTLSKDWSADQALLKETIEKLRQKLQALPEDPFLIIKKEVEITEESRVQSLLPAQEMLASIQDMAQGLDLVGILASGKIYRGFGNSLGQINWFETSSVHFDWSIYDREDKAIKESFADTVWNPELLAKAMEAARNKLGLLQRKSRRLQPGKYRVYLAPSAMDEIWDLVSWEGFGLKYYQTKNSPLQALYEGRMQLDQRIVLKENVASGVHPIFNEYGFLRPKSTNLIVNGRYGGALISPRSAQEFAAACNGADQREFPVALYQQGGALHEDDVLKTLDRGLYISNLWYLNFSDHSNCRMTGLTRFATFWVENGELCEPVDVMRFDESLYRMLGSNLVDLTKAPSLLVSASTYGSRSTVSRCLPGAIVDEFQLTL